MRHCFATLPQALLDYLLPPLSRGDSVPPDAHAPADDVFSEDEVIWVFGHPRSGTTWLANLLRDGFGAKLWNEPYLGQFLAFRNRLRENEPVRLEDPTFWFSDPQEESWQASLNLFFVDVIARQGGTRTGYDALVIKEPNGTAVAPLIAKIMPRARFVMVVRDIRDVTASMIDARRPGAWMARRLTAEFDRMQIVRQAVTRMQQIVPQIREMRSTVPDGHYYEMHYERLRSGTYDELASLGHALSLPVDEERLRAGVHQHAYDRIPEAKKGPGHFVRTGQVGSWRTELTREEVAFIQQRLECFLDEHGYELADPTLFPETVG